MIGACMLSFDNYNEGYCVQMNFKLITKVIGEKWPFCSLCKQIYLNT